MKFFLILLAVICFSKVSSSNEYYITNNCYEAMLEMDIDSSSISIINEDNFYKPTFKRIGTENVILKSVDFGIPQFDGMYVSYNNENIIHCWPPFTYVTAILLEKTDLYYEPLGNYTSKAIKVHLHLHVYRGPGDLASKLETIYFVHKSSFLKEILIGDTHEYPSPWFINYLTLEEARIFFKQYEFDSFEWKGKKFNLTYN